MDNRMVFINLPVDDVERSKAFFTALGFTFDTRFQDDTCTCLVIEEGSIYSMLMTRERFGGFFAEGATLAAPDAHEVGICLSADSRAEVDRLADAALAAGASPWTDAMDHGSMYGRSFRDPDGHVWELMWMDQSFIDDHHPEPAVAPA